MTGPEVPPGEHVTVIGSPRGEPRPYVVTGAVAGLLPNRVAWIDGAGVAAHVAAGVLIPFRDDPPPAPERSRRSRRRS